MTVVSSHLKRPEFKMRVLIVSAFLACAVAAPSGITAPYINQPVILPGVVPTISSGDIQAAAIDAQVKANDLARAAADKAQEAADQAININAKAAGDNDQINEKNLEAFWANQERKWQALDALKTAEAQADGIVVTNADLYAKAAIGEAVPYIAPAAPVVAPLSPVVYNPYLTAVKTISTEEKKEENQQVAAEAATKIAEPQPAATVETPAEQSNEKSSEGVNKPVVFTSPVITSFPSALRYNVIKAAGPVIAQYSSFPEEKKEENQQDAAEAGTKITEPQKATTVETPAEQSTEKSSEGVNEPVIFKSPLITSFPSALRYNVIPAAGPVFAQYSSFPVPGAYAPTFVQSVW